MNSILVQHAGLGGKLYGVIIKIKGLGFIWVPIYQLINTVELWFWSIIIIGGLCKHFIWLEDMYFTWFPCLTVYPSKPADKISVNSHMCVFFSVPSLISCLHTLLSPPLHQSLWSFSICVLKAFFVNQAICPSLFGVQTVVRYPVTDPVCSEWQLLSGQLVEGLRNIPERII